MQTAAAMLFRWRLSRRTGKPGNDTDDDLMQPRACPRDAVFSHPRCADCHVADERLHWSGATHGGGGILPSEVLPINISDYIAVQL
ncbi:hypothetical protein [Mesorhizobium sp.]|uniref:hypothetical protein n=1 Tax=Mesorhizobium sp. TaxID=1871066 RepID=UPI0025FDF4B9|nr:hypothetical protein [Mesorhizobium sp.]